MEWGDWNTNACHTFHILLCNNTCVRDKIHNKIHFSLWFSVKIYKILKGHEYLFKFSNKKAKDYQKRNTFRLI